MLGMLGGNSHNFTVPHRPRDNIPVQRFYLLGALIMQQYVKISMLKTENKILQSAQWKRLQPHPGVSVGDLPK